jgi:hypothetical protein
MGYYRDRDDVAGASDVFYPNRSNVAGARDRRRRDDRDFRVPVKAFIKSEDFCRAVRRCLIDDLVAAARDDRDDDKRKCCRRW